MPIHAISAQTLENLKSLVDQTEGSGGALASETPIATIIYILEELNNSIAETDINMPYIQKLLEDFDKQARNISQDEHFKNDQNLKKVLPLAENIIVKLRSDPFYTYLCRVRDMESELHSYIAITANNKITSDINTLIETTKTAIRNSLESELKNPRSIWNNFTLFMTSNKISDAKKFTEELKKTPDYQIAHQILENIALKFLSSQDGPGTKAKSAKNYEFLFSQQIKSIGSKPLQQLLTALKDNIMKYKFLEAEQISRYQLENIINAQIEKQFAEFVQTPLGAYVVAKRAYEEKAQSFHSILQKTSVNEDILEALQRRMTECKLHIEDPEDLAKVDIFDNISNKNNFELLSMMLPADEYRSFAKKILTAIHDALKEAPVSELATRAPTRKAWG